MHALYISGGSSLKVLFTCHHKTNINTVVSATGGSNVVFIEIATVRVTVTRSKMTPTDLKCHAQCVNNATALSSKNCHQQASHFRPESDDVEHQ